jgi:hypothetical protein
MQTRVIGVGYSKTGTTTLRECFRELGLSFIGFDVELTRQVVAGKSEPAIAALSAYEAAANWPWPLIYQEIDEAYPGSRFILTVRRDAQTWVRSLISQAAKKPNGEYRSWVYGHGDPVGHEEELIARYEAHNAAVREHFADRPAQLLEVCWETGSGWRELCGFLGKPTPQTPFPLANVSKPRVVGTLKPRKPRILSALPRSIMTLGARRLGQIRQTLRQWQILTPKGRDQRHWLLAERAFLAGRTDLAELEWSRIRHDRWLCAKAHLMQDWVRFQRGDYTVGWPRYPGTEFTAPDPGRVGSSESSRAIRVATPRQPVELATELGMTQWDGQSQPLSPLLVWFNFTHSIGGEILASRLVQLLSRRYAGPLVLATHGRLQPLLQASFPHCRVIDKAGDLRGAASDCRQFVLARDLLKALVADDEDIEEIAAHRLVTPDVAHPPREPSPAPRPRVAIAWKTTNQDQGQYRNLPPADLAPLLGRFDIEWHVAQHGDMAADVAMLRRLAPQATILEHTLDPAGDMAALAVALSRLDAVLTIDNTLLHLAGGLGIRTIGLLSVPAYWAWPDRGSTSRWYASVTLHRQVSPRDWQPPLQSAEHELRALLSSLTTSRVAQRCALP